MTDLWRGASQATQRFAAQALDYDRYRPRYPESMFDDMMEMAGLAPGAKAIEVGAGTGIATEPLVRRGLAVTAIEPAAEMAAIAKSKLCAGMGSRAESFVFDPPIWSRERDVSWYGSPPSEKHQSLLRTSYS